MTLYPFDLFPAKDGRISLAVAQPHHWELLCAVMERADMILDERSATNAARLQNVDWVEAQICAWTTQYTRTELMAKLDGRLPAGPVQNMADIFADDHVRARGMLEPCQPMGIIQVSSSQLALSNFHKRLRIFTARHLSSAPTTRRSPLNLVSMCQSRLGLRCLDEAINLTRKLLVPLSARCNHEAGTRVRRATI